MLPPQPPNAPTPNLEQTTHTFQERKSVAVILTHSVDPELLAPLHLLHIMRLPYCLMWPSHWCWSSTHTHSNCHNTCITEPCFFPATPIGQVPSIHKSLPDTILIIVTNTNCLYAGPRNGDVCRQSSGDSRTPEGGGKANCHTLGCRVEWFNVQPPASPLRLHQSHSLRSSVCSVKVDHSEVYLTVWTCSCANVNHRSALPKVALELCLNGGLEHLRVETPHIHCIPLEFGLTRPASTYGHIQAMVKKDQDRQCEGHQVLDSGVKLHRWNVQHKFPTFNTVQCWLQPYASCLGLTTLPFAVSCCLL